MIIRAVPVAFYDMSYRGVFFLLLLLCLICTASLMHCRFSDSMLVIVTFFAAILRDP